MRGVCTCSGIELCWIAYDCTCINDCVCVETDVPIIGKSYKLLYVGDDKKGDIKNKLKQALHKYEMPVLIKNVEAIGFGKNYKKERQ